MKLPLWKEVTGAWKPGQNLAGTVALTDSDHCYSAQAGICRAILRLLTGGSGVQTHPRALSCPTLGESSLAHIHPNSLPETCSSLCLVQWVKFAPPPPPSRILSLNLSQVVNIPLALRECDKKAKRVEGKGAEGALDLERQRPGLSKSGVALLKELMVLVFRENIRGRSVKKLWLGP